MTLGLVADGIEQLGANQQGVAFYLLYLGYAVQGGFGDRFLALMMGKQWPNGGYDTGDITDAFDKARDSSN